MAINLKQILVDDEKLSAVEESDALIHEVQEIEAEHAEQLRPVEEKLERVRELQDYITDEGVSREVATRIGELNPASQEDQDGAYNPFEQKGLTLESFTTFPSRVNMQYALEELSDQSRNILIGAGAVVALGVLGKLIHVIWKFFKRGGSGGSAKAAEEATEEARAQIERIEQIQRDLEEASRGNEQLAAAYAELNDAIEQTRAKEHERLQQYYNALLDDLFKGTSEFSQSCVKLINAFDEYSNSIDKGDEYLAKIKNQWNTWVSNPEQHLSEMKSIEEAIKKTMPSATLGMNIEKVKNLVDEAKAMEQNEVDMSPQAAKNIVNDLKAGSYSSLIHGLFSKVGNSGRAHRSDDKQRRTLETLDSLQELATKARENNTKFPKEFADSFISTLSYYRETLSTYVAISALFIRISDTWKLFIKKVQQGSIEEEQKMKGWFKKMAPAQRDEFMKKLENSHNKDVQALVKTLRTMGDSDG